MAKFANKSMQAKAEKAMERAKEIADGPVAMAKKISDAKGNAITSQAVSGWKICPPHHVLLVEEITGVSRHELRPDVFREFPEAAQ